MKASRILLFVQLILFSIIAFSQSHNLNSTKSMTTTEKHLKNQDVVWEVTFDETPAVWTLGHNQGDADWTRSDTTITGVDYEVGVDFINPDLPTGTMVSSAWYYCGQRDVGEFSASGGNFAWIDGVTDILMGTEEIKNTWIQFDGLDLSEVDVPKLCFYQNFKQLNTAYCYLDISTDGGLTWDNEILMNENVEVHDYGDDYCELILSDYIANEVNVSLRFRWQTTSANNAGYGYGWQIDDVQIVENPDVDIKLEKGVMNFFTYADYNEQDFFDYFHMSSHYGMIPQKQFESDDATMIFNGIVTNFGNQDVIPEFNVKVYNPDLALIYDEAVIGTSLAAFETDTLDLLTEFLLNDPVIGEYTVVYNLNETNDQNLINNVDTTYFNVTENTFGRDLGNVNYAIGPRMSMDAGNNGDMIATDYVVLYDCSIEEVDVYIHEASDPESQMLVHIKQYDESSDKWETVAYSEFITIEESMLGEWYSFSFSEIYNFYPGEAPSDNTLRVAVEFYYEDSESNCFIGYDNSMNTSKYGIAWNFSGGNYEWFYSDLWTHGGLGIRLKTNEIVSEETTPMFMSYTFPQHNGSEIDINYFEKTINLNVEAGTDLTQLVSDFTLSDQTTAYIDGVEQVSGVTVNDFSDAVIYTLVNSYASENWTVTVNEGYFFSEDATICYEDSLFWHNQYYSESGIYFAEYESVESGCDSVYQLELFVTPGYMFHTLQYICEGDSFTWHDSIYFDEGTFYAHYSTEQLGCDSSYVLQLLYYPNPAYQDLIQYPSDGILQYGNMGEIGLESSYASQYYWVTCGGSVVLDEIEGTGGMLSLGNNYPAGTYEIWSRNNADCTVLQGSVTFIEESENNQIVVNVTYGYNAEQFFTGEVEVTLYRFTTDIAVEDQQVLSDNGNVIFENVEPGQFYLSSTILNPDDYFVSPHVYYESALIYEDAILVNLDSDDLLYATLHHPAMSGNTGSNTVTGVVGVGNTKADLDPKKNMVVILRNIDDASVIDVSVTNDAGEYEFSEVPDNANLELFVSSFEYSQWTPYNLQTNTDDDYEVNFMLSGNEVFPMSISDPGSEILIDATIYPNPSTGIVTVESKNLNMISVSSLDGKQMLQKTVSTDMFTLDLSNFSAGMYLIKLETDTGVRFKKIILE
jgi:hypothetical protein